jgi:hypothetical protein
MIMKKSATALLLLVLMASMAACSVSRNPVSNNHYVDREFGQAQMASWDKMIAHPEAPMAGEIPTGMSGIAAEEVMTVRNKAFAEKPTKGIIDLGILQK